MKFTTFFGRATKEELVYENLKEFLLKRFSFTYGQVEEGFSPELFQNDPASDLDLQLLRAQVAEAAFQYNDTVPREEQVITSQENISVIVTLDGLLVILVYFYLMDQLTDPNADPSSLEIIS